MQSTPRTPRKIGRPVFAPTGDKVQDVILLRAVGVGQSKVALLISITPKTLRKHFRHELDTANVDANLLVMQSLFEMARTCRGLAAANRRVQHLSRFFGRPVSSLIQQPPADGISVHINDGAPNGEC